MRIRPARPGGLDESLRAAAWPWAVGRVVVLGALALARYLGDHVHPAPAVLTRIHEGLLGWDAGYYRDLALHGYSGLPRAALRFFPLLPLVTRWAHRVTGLSAGTCLVVIVNVCALAAAVALHRLVVAEAGDRELARRAVWLLALAPSAFVLVMGYSEAPMILLSVLAFRGYRGGRWWLSAAAGYLAGLTRPIGAVLALPAALEAARGTVLRTRQGSGGAVTGRGLAGRLAAVAAPVAGTVTYLGWVSGRFGDFWLPLRIQESGRLHGRLADPVSTAAHDLRDLFHGHIGTGLHVPWLVVFAGLLVVAFLRWPASYGLYAVGILGLAVSSSNFDSLERYALSAFPLVLAGAGLTEAEQTERVVLSLLGALLLAYSLLAFTNSLVP